MLKLLLPICILGCIVTPVISLPPATKLLAVEDAVSTELSLGRSAPRQAEWSASPVAVVHYQENLLPGGVTRPQLLQLFSDTSSRESQDSTLRNKGLIHFSQSSGATASRPQQASPAEREIVSQTANLARVPITPGLDPSLEAATTRYLRDGLFMTLPSTSWYHLDSSWFESFYSDAVNTFGDIRLKDRFGQELMKTTLTQAELNEVHTRNIAILQGKLPIYKLNLHQEFSSRLDKGEVLIRYHHSLTLDSKIQLRWQLSAWSTGNQGQTLV